MDLCSEFLKVPRMETPCLSQRPLSKLKYLHSEDFFPNLHPESPKLLFVAAALSTTASAKKSFEPIILVTPLQLAADCNQKVKPMSMCIQLMCFLDTNQTEDVSTFFCLKKKEKKKKKKKKDKLGA